MLLQKMVNYTILLIALEQKGYHRRMKFGSQVEKTQRSLDMHYHHHVNKKVGMKILNQIIIVIIFIGLVYVVKTDYKSVPSRILSYLESEISKVPLSDIRMGDSDHSVDMDKDRLTSVETPGALVVSDSYLTRDTKNINLTIKGVIDITNKQRSLNGNLLALKENYKLDFSAEKKLQDMFVKGYFDHVSPDGVGVGDLGSQVSYEYIIIGENLALGNFKDNQSLVDAWMASEGHRANILNKRYTDIGVAVGKGSYQGKVIWMAVQHFGLPKSACPSIDEVLKGIIAIDQKTIKTIEEDLTRKKAKVDSGAVSNGMTTSEQINEYNSLVNDYNKLIINIKQKINTYNEQVRSFNHCIGEVD